MEREGIRPLGRLFKIDEQGYIVNDAKYELITPKWLDATQSVIEKLLTSEYAPQIKSVYMRGSVVRGLAVDNISDLDFIAFVDKSAPQDIFSRDFKNVLRQDTLEKFPFVEGVELSEVVYTDFIHGKMSRGTRIVLGTQSIHIAGEDLKAFIQPVLVGEKAIMHLWNLEDFYQKYLGFPSTPANLTWYLKRVVRAGHELVFAERKSYTRDLYWCGAEFLELYPQQAERVKKMLLLSIKPELFTQSDSELITDFTEFLLKERISRYPKRYTSK